MQDRHQQQGHRLTEIDQLAHLRVRQDGAGVRFSACTRYRQAGRLQSRTLQDTAGCETPLSAEWGLSTLAKFLADARGDAGHEQRLAADDAFQGARC